MKCVLPVLCSENWLVLEVAVSLASKIFKMSKHYKIQKIKYRMNTDSSYSPYIPASPSRKGAVSTSRYISYTSEDCVTFFFPDALTISLEEVPWSGVGGL